MTESSLQDRLAGHAKAFDGLLSLIPAKFYYGEDTSDQWKKKKQTKEQAAAARRAKLDPDSAKTAKDVMDERARKRKLEELEDDDQSEIEGVEKELPKEGMKQPQLKKVKKRKESSDTDTPASSDKITVQKISSKAEKRQLKLERKKEKKLRLQKTDENSKRTTKDDVVDEGPDNGVMETAAENDDEDIAMANDREDVLDHEIEHFDAEGLADEIGDNVSASVSASPSSPIFDKDPSTNTSTSSVIPPATAPKHIKLPTDPELLRSRLTARIEALRAARKADGLDGRPARNRQELLEARRKKEEQRKAHKKELRMKAKEEEDARREAALASARDSPSSGLMSPAIRSPEHQFSFGRVSFGDGQQLTDDLTALRGAPRKRGPQDAATALLANEKKRQRIAGLDEEKQADIEEKDLWLNAKKRVHGEKVRDDTSLLKKTLKRKEKAKKKSEKEWNDRKEGVAKSQAMKQKKREENLKKRRDEKGTKGKGKGKSVKSKKTKVKSRPGFEGSFGSGRRK